MIVSNLPTRRVRFPPRDSAICWRATPAHALACDRASTTRSPLIAMVDPFTSELDGAIVHPGLLVRLVDQDGAAFAVAVWFIL